MGDMTMTMPIYIYIHVSQLHVSFRIISTQDGIQESQDGSKHGIGTSPTCHGPGGIRVALTITFAMVIKIGQGSNANQQSGLQTSLVAYAVALAYT